MIATPNATTQLAIGKKAEVKKAEFLIRQRGYTQTAFAEQTGLSRTKLNLILHGREKPWPKYRNTIAEALGWNGDPAELFEEVDELWAIPANTPTS